MPSDADVLRALVAKGEQVTPASLSPVFSLKTGWVIGRIADHTAHPLNTTDAMLATEYACDMLNSRPALARFLASHAALVARHARLVEAAGNVSAGEVYNQEDAAAWAALDTILAEEAKETQ